MGIINFFINLLKDPRTAIASWISMGVAPTLGFIFLIVFVETGVVFFPFLPGDSLLFAAGFFAAPDAQTGVSALPLFALLPVVWCAPIIGDQCNYWIGHFFGRRIIESGRVKAMTPERLAKTEGMIEKWGPLAVFLGRFFPFIRTFMPFISGISGMRWSRFTPFSVLGGLCWSTLFTLLGYFFGGIPAVQKHFELVIIAILVLSLIPTFVGLLKAKFGRVLFRSSKQSSAKRRLIPRPRKPDLTFSPFLAIAVSSDFSEGTVFVCFRMLFLQGIFRNTRISQIAFVQTSY